MGTRPNRPGQGNRPGIDQPIRDRPANRPANRPAQRPINISNDRYNNIRNNWQGAINRPSTLPTNPGRWNDWAGNVHDRWNGAYDGSWNNDHWWHDHSDCNPWWHDYHCHHDHGWNYWWTVPTWGAITGWYGGSWGEPVYYDYGTNVVYQDDSVYVNGSDVATAEEYSQTAFTQADPAWTQTADPAQTEWMPLGVFALSLNEQESNPSRTVQLAVSKEGYISGLYYNEAKDDAREITGSVDRTTQRACWKIKGSDNIVFDTGIYNLTQDTTPVLVHFGTDKTETYLMVRLEEPSGQASGGETALP